MTTPTRPPTRRRIARYGWVADLPDARDHLFSAPRIALAALPPSADVSGTLPPCYDQGRIGSCTANAIAGAFEFALRKQELADFMPSRLFIYYNERAVEGHPHTDSGAQIRDGPRSVGKQGVCAETEWPYDDTPADESTGLFPAGARDGERPADQCYTDALSNRAITYQRVTQHLDQLRGCLAAGYPFVFGFTVYDSFESQQVALTGEAQLPQPGEQVLGGHAVLATGYDDSQQRFLVRNSLGTGWGKDGYFGMPYAYLTDRGLASDFWTVRVVN
ncbi:MAG TPA: C1 family peptidase [Pseudonocardiaceae bacterium]|nr:C1 family peptidase [Pseudonocardiaceae bacterium]